MLTETLGRVQILVPLEALQIFQAAVLVEISNANESLFWEDRWLERLHIQDIALRLYNCIRPRVRASRTVSDVVQGQWPWDVGPDLQAEDVAEYLGLSKNISMVEYVADKVRRAWEPSGIFFVRSA